MPEVAQATLAVTPVLKGAQQSIREQLTGAASPAGMAAGNVAGKSFGDQLGKFAVKAVAALGVGKMIGDSVSKGMDFETSMAKASTLFTGTSSELASLQNQILGISSATGIAAAELAEAAYSAESASVPMGNLGSMLESSSKLATAGFTDIDTALSATAKTMNAYGMMSDDVTKTQENMDKVQKVLIQTQNKGITTVDELGRSLAQVTPTAAAAHVGFEQVGAALSLMTAQGTPTAQATTQLRSAIAELEKSGTQASKALEASAEGTKYAGMSFVEMMDSGADLGEVMGMLQKYADKSGVSMLDLWSSIEGGNAAMAIAKDVSAFDDDLAAMATDADVVGDAYETMSDTVGHKLEELKRSLENIGISAFGAVADDLVDVLDNVGQVVEDITPALGEVGSAFMDMAGSAVDTIADFMGIDDGLSTTEKTAEVLKTGMESLADVFEFASENMDVIIPIITAVGGAMLFTSGPLGKVTQGVGGLIGKLSSIGSEAETAAAPIESAGASFGSMAGEALKMIAAAAALYVAAQAFSVLADAAIRITEAGWPAIAVLGGMAVGIGALMYVASAVGPALTAGAVGIGVFGVSLLAIGGGVALACAGITMVIDAVGRLVEVITSNSEEINSIVTNVGDTVDGTITTISDGITSVIDAISGGISGVLDSVAGIFESMGGAALDAGTGFEKLAGAVLNLTKNTGVLDLAGTMAAVASGVSKVNKAASEAGAGADSINALSKGLMTIGISATASAKGMTLFSSASAKSVAQIGASFSKLNFSKDMNREMSKTIASARSGISILKGMFESAHFSFNQHIAVPHFSMSGSFNAQTGSTPTVSTRWYRVAESSPYLFHGATLFGGGEHSDEILYGREALLNDIREASGGRPITNNFYIYGNENPEHFAHEVARELRMEMRMA